jgi:hypothetical protein
MERRFTVEAKSFSFSVVSGKSMLCLEENAKVSMGLFCWGSRARTRSAMR